MNINLNNSLKKKFNDKPLLSMIEKIVNTSYIKLQEDTSTNFIKTTTDSIFHSGDEINRLRSGKYIFKNNKKIPMFFSNEYISSLYLLPSTYKYKYSFTKPLRLFEISSESLEYIFKLYIEEDSYQIDDTHIIIDLFVCLGYVPKILNEIKKKEFREHLKKRVSELFKTKESYLRLLNNFPDPQNDFNRISSSEQDIKTFDTLFTHIFQNINLNTLFSSCDGIYFPPLNPGFNNITNFISVFDIFPEEIFLKKSFVEECVESSSVNIEQLDSYTNMNTLFKNDINIDDILKYIYYIQQIYEKISLIFLRIIQDDLNYMYLTIDSRSTLKKEQESAILNMKAVLQQKSASIQFEILNLIVESFFIKTLKIDRLIDINNESIENFLIFNALRNVLDKGIHGFQNILNNFELEMFIPIVSGGYLFDCYSFGEYKRNIKDIDIKICQINNELNNEINNEYNHTRLTICIYLWQEIMVELIQYIASARISSFVSLLPESFNKIKKKYGRNVKYDVYLSTRSSSLKQFDMILYSLLPDIYKEHIYQIWDSYLKRKINMNIKEYNTIRKKYTIEEYNIIVKKEEYKNKLFDKINTSSLIHTNNNSKTINSYKSKYINDTNLIIYNDTIKTNTLIYIKDDYDDTLKNYTIEINKIHNHIENIDAVFLNFTKETRYDETTTIYDVFYTQIIDIYKINKYRPIIKFDNTYSYKVGSFLTINIKKGDNIYGLIDYTFDTEYSSKGTFVKPSQTDISHTIVYNGIECASYFDFLKETYKLYHICNIIYPFEDYYISEKNPYNMCSPDKKMCSDKKIKYLERYNKVLQCGNYIVKNGIKNSNVNFKTIDELYNYLLQYIDKHKNKKMDQRTVSYEIIKFCELLNIEIEIEIKKGGNRKRKFNKTRRVCKN